LLLDVLVIDDLDVDCESGAGEEGEIIDEELRDER
jgi:hypothetical protein